jgi:hypothetical protein
MRAVNSQRLKQVVARILFPVGIIALIVGALDPLEGSVLILAGSGLLAFSTWLGNQARSLAVYRTWLFAMIAFGVLAMFVLSAMGGLGGETGLSPWWALVLLPYPVGWLLEVANLIAGAIRRFRRRRAAANSEA